MGTSHIREQIKRCADPQRGTIPRTTADLLMRACDKDDAAHDSPRPTITGRGFQRHAPVPSEYGGHIETYESSAASGPHLWVNIECPVDLNNPAGAKKDATVHLPLENAILLRVQLTQLIENHYQVR